jgi:hypothetical protein
MKFENYAVLLKSAIAVIVFLFGAFSGFLLKFTPPDPSDELGIPIGIAQFLSLALLLFVSLLCNYQATKKKADQRKFVRLWLYIAGSMIIIFAVSSIFYYSNLKQHTIRQSDWNVTLIRGTELTPDSRDICKEDKQNRSDEECESYLLYKYYNANEIIDKHFLWTEKSVNAMQMRLLIIYIIVIVTISGLLFSLVELLSWNMFNKKPPDAPKPAEAPIK